MKPKQKFQWLDKHSHPLDDHEQWHVFRLFWVNYFPGMSGGIYGAIDGDGIVVDMHGNETMFTVSDILFWSWVPGPKGE